MPQAGEAADSGEEDSSDAEANGFTDPMAEAEQYGSLDFDKNDEIFSANEKENALARREMVTADRLRGGFLCVGCSLQYSQPVGRSLHRITAGVQAALAPTRSRKRV